LKYKVDIEILTGNEAAECGETHFFASPPGESSRGAIRYSEH
jgi:hypothetical protein